MSELTKCPIYDSTSHCDDTSECIECGVFTDDVKSIENAVAWFENEIRMGYCNVGENCPQCNAYIWAAKALREKIEKDKEVEP